MGKPAGQAFMKKIILIVTGFILSFTLGYWVKALTDFGEAMGKDNVRLYELKTDTIEKVVLNEGSKENFDDFLYKFMEDSLYQFDRIKFPLKTDDVERPDKIFIEKKDWKFTKLYSDNEYKVQTYDNFEAKLGDTDERVIAWEGVGNGIRIRLIFQRIDGLWYLIESIDHSD